MTFLHHPPCRCLGVDVAKDTIAIFDGRIATVIPNQRKQIRHFLRKCDVDLVICEPTGGYEIILMEECRGLKLPLHRADTRKLKAFIRSRGRLGKSDAIDAREMVAYGLERWATLPLWHAEDPCEARLKALVRRRADLVAMRVAEQNRAKAPSARELGGRDLAATFKALLTVLNRQIVLVDKAISALMRSASLVQRARTATAMKGIGETTAAALIAAIPELGKMDRKQAAALAGLAPHPNESGNKIGYRRMRGGRPAVRTILFMPAMQAAQGRGEFVEFYKRLIHNGKKPIVALAAVMRKIVITLNARFRDQLSQQS
ncbi:IS110 family RNA-guided transposase [Martelella soudanensis]|uniref:IS110 family transposase n=1 Tax=unclassified Martelella TaxID=2629616 RepID=UPI0015DEE660|nr:MULTISPECIES: IS110 family transposase [unclassified Martelella]